MKTLKLTVIAFALCAFSLTVKANDKIEDSPLNQFKAINTYVDAIAQGRADELEHVVDNSAKFSFLRGETIRSYSKTEMLDFLKQNKNITQGCTINTEVVSSNADVSVIKVDMKYDNVVRTNYVTLANNGKDWKITDVYSVFK